jgi:phosphoribosylformylglycinamidine synthase
LFHSRTRAELAEFFLRRETFTLGICNGCQMVSHLAELIPGAAGFPRFVRNRSEQFEARLSLVRVEKSRSVLLAGMEGSLLPIAVSHGEGRAEFEGEGARSAFEASGRVAVRFVDSQGEIASRYPENPNGSPAGIAAITSEDGRATLIMPHPERVFRAVQYSWRPRTWREDAPWMRLFRNARAFVG